ncbi:MAG: HEAT repeat domain-containing protein [Myxococcota bacterium]
MLKPLALALLVVASLAAPAAAGPARPRSDQRASLVELLAAYELRLDRATLDSIGPEVPQMLIDIAGKPRERATVRVRALAALAFYPTVFTQAFLRAQLWERGWIGTPLGVQMRAQAMRSLGRAFGENAVDDIAALKDDPDPLVRAAVATALVDAGSPNAVPLLESWLPNESVFTVRDAVDRALQKLRGK